METKVNPWKSNLTSGIILGLVGIMYSLIMYYFNLTLNKTQGYIFAIIQIALLYFLLKSYRDNFKYGQISFGESFGAGVIICLYYSLIMAVFSYVLYTLIDPDLVAKQLAMSEEVIRAKKNITEADVEKMMSFNQKIMKPGILSIFGIIVGMFFGTIFSLIVSIFVMKEGNPLIDTSQN